MTNPLLFYGAITGRNEDGSHTDELGKSEWFVKMPDGKCYALAPALSVPAVPPEWIEHLGKPT